jgi:very-short-patch-repair endonuclease
MDEIAVRMAEGAGVLARRDHRDIAGSLDRLLRTGTLVAMFPGVYCLSAAVEDIAVRIQAAARWAGPDAVLTGWSAARLTFWPTCPVDRVTLALPTQAKRSRKDCDVECRRLPPDLVGRAHGLSVTRPSVTAVDLAVEGGEVIDRALRTGTATLRQMHEALQRQPHRDGNALRATLLHDSRDEPWSEAERLCHRVLRAAGITGWQTNISVTAAGRRYVVDLLFDRVRLVVEVDGWDVHGTRKAFEEDRRRRNALVLAGFRVLNFTWRQLSDEPDWVIWCIRQALR